jgi:dolichol-phosphate mannosyltransferase
MTGAWIVIPTYNEADNLAPLVKAVRAAIVGSILIVDDNSPDGTGLIADSLAAAYVDGFRLALASGAEYVIEMDADFSHDPADLPRLLEAARDGADIVLGSRYVPGGSVEGWSLDRQILSRAGGVYARAVLGSEVRDLTGGFKCFRADALRAIGLDNLTAEGYTFQVEATFRAARAGLRIEEVPIVFRERRAGRSKMSPAIAAEAIWRIPEMRLAARRRRVPAPAVSTQPG